MLRATFKSLLSRKLRLILSGLAVVLGVMFVSGSLVLTNTLDKSFDKLFANAYSNTHVEVTGKQKVNGGDQQAEPANVPAGLVSQIKAVPGVADAMGVVTVDGAHVIGTDGKVLTTSGAPRFGVNWTNDGIRTITAGQAPAADNQIAVDAGIIEQTHFKVGDQVGVSVFGVKHMFTLSGIFEYGGHRASLGGEQTVAFTTPVAQQLMLRDPNSFSGVVVSPDPGVSDNQLRDKVAAAVGGDYVAKTGKQLAADSAATISKALSFVNYIFLGFAGVALFVGTFLILNTFSIIVAQRTKELALLRALGGSRNQMIGSVLTEAFVIGVLASTIGMLAGLGIGSLLAYVFTHVGGGSLSLSGVGLPTSAVISSYAVGVTITMIAALLPALRAARIAPIAAMRDAATPDKPLTKLTTVGAVIFTIGAVMLGFGLAGAGGATLLLILVGVLISFVGVAVLTPAISRPIVALLGAIFAASIPGKLGKRNSARNPRRTAITAAALMVGIALITAITVVIGSAKTSFSDAATTTVKADLIISGDAGQGQPASFDGSVLTKTAALPGVHEVAGIYSDAAEINGKASGIGAVSDTRALQDVFSLKPAAGSIATIRPDQIVVDEPTATSEGLHVGSPVTVQLGTGAPKTYTLSGTYQKSLLFNGFVLDGSQAAGFRSAQPQNAFVQLTPGTNVDQVKQQVSTLLADSPEVNVTNFNAYVKQQAAGFDSVIQIIQILLALAIVIAILGVINTLALSVLERTKELGLLRAIGLSRSQTMYMVTVESIVISVFGAVLGLLVGTGLGAAVVQALRDQGLKHLSLPYGQMIAILILSAIVGVVAGVLPAIRAARTNVLGAISYE